MLIPRKLSKVGTHCDSESSRYALGGILLERDDDGVNAVASDGRRLIHLQWNDSELDVDNSKIGESVNLETEDNFQTIVLASDLESAAKANKPKVSQVKIKPILDYVGLDEKSSNGKLRIVSTDGVGVSTKDCKAIEGRFPAWRKIVPDVSDHICITLNWEYLRDACIALGTICGDVENQGLDIYVKDSESAIVIRSNQKLSIRGQCIIMPMDNDRK